MATEAVRLVLESNGLRQLGEEGLLVLWREGGEPGRREGLACILSLCPDPDCACQLVHVDGFAIDGQASAVAWDQDGVHLERPTGEDTVRVTLKARMHAIVDPHSGETRAHPDLPDSTDPALVDWLASEMDEDLLEVLHRYRARAKGYLPEGPRKNIDLDAVEEYPLASVDDLVEGTRSDEYLLGDRRYWTAVFLCPTPGCDCHEAQVVFFDVEAESGDSVGALLLDIGGPTGFKIKEKTAEGGAEPLLEELWRSFERRHDVGRFLRRREAQLKEVGATLWHPVSEAAPAAPKIGRNDPCRCGSGRKFKNCCGR